MSEDPNDLQVLSVVQSEVEASLIVNHLADNGITARAAGASLGATWPQLPWGEMQVIVRQADVSRAKELLDSLPPRDEQSPRINRIVWIGRWAVALIFIGWLLYRLAGLAT
jgi:hypothetical protein